MGSLPLASSYHLDASLKQYSSVWKRLYNSENPLLDSEAEEKDLCSSTPLRTPKLRLAVEQPSTGECWISPKKTYPHVPGQRRNPNRMAGGAKLRLESNLIPTRVAQRVQTEPCLHQDPGKGAVTPTRDSVRPAWECLSVSCGGAGQQWPALGTERWLQQAGGRGIWPKSSWRRSPLAPPQSHHVEDAQNGEQLYQRTSHTVAKVLGPTTDFPTWGSGKGTENPQGIWLWRPVGFDYQTSTGQETDSLRARTKPCAHQDPGGRSSDPTGDWARLAYEHPEVSSGSMARYWPATGSGALNTTVLGAEVCWHKSFWRRSSSPPLTPPQFDLSQSQTTGGFPDSSVGKESACSAETLVWFLGWEDVLEKGQATHSSMLDWRTPWTIHGVTKSQTGLSNFHKLQGRNTDPHNSRKLD